MPDHVFPLDYLYPLAYIESAQTFIRDSWIASNNDAPQVFERGTGIVTRLAPDILDLMSATSSLTIPTGPSVITRWISPGPKLETISRSGCKKWCDMQLNVCEAELGWTTGFAWVLFIILIILILILLLFCCCCRRAKTADKGIGTDPEPESKPVDTTGIEDLQKRLARQQNDCDEEKANLRGRLAQQEKRRDEEKASLQKQLAQQQEACDEEKVDLRQQLSQQEEECEEEKLELRRELVQAGKDSEILKLELQAAGPAATATDKDDLIDAQRDQLKGQRTMLEAERGRYLRLMKKNAGLKQDQVKSAQQVDKLQRDVAEVKRRRLAEGQECDEEKQRLDDEVKKAHKQLQLAQHDILALLGQIDALEKPATRPDVIDQSMQTEKKTKNQGSQTEKKIKDQTTQNLVDQQTQTTASVGNQTGTITGTAPAPQAPSVQDQISDGDRMKRVERENLRLQNQYDTARADAVRVDRENMLLQRLNDTARSDVAHLRRAHEGHGKYQKTLEDLLASSKIVEQNVKEINQRIPHSHNVCEPRGVVNSTPSRHSSQQDSEQNLCGKEDVDDEEEKPDCDSTRCHECPRYAGEKHHICVKSNVKVPITENNPVFKIQAGEEDESEIEDKHEDEEDEVEAPKLPLVSRVPKLGPAPVTSYPSPPLPPKTPPIPLKPEIPPISAIDFLTNRISKLPVPPSGTAEFEGRQRLKELRATFRADYKAFQEDARRTTCSGRRHSKKLEYAANARSGSRNKIDSKTWAPDFDFEDFQKRCKEGLRTWAEGHAQDRKHLPKQCSQEDIENANDCLPADPVEPAVDFDSEDEIEAKAVANEPDANKSIDDLNSLFRSSEDETIIREQSPTNANTKDEKKSDKATPGYENTGTSGLGKPPPSASSHPKVDPKAVIGEIKPATPVSGAGPSGEQGTVNHTGQSEQPKAPTKPSSEQVNPGSAASNVLSTVSPTPKAGDGVDTSDQLSGKKPTGAASNTQKPTNPPRPTVDTPLVPPNLPLPFQESSPDAILKYEAERGHEFTRLPTSGNGFLCGVNAVELTTAHMHPEIQGLTAAALMEVLDWQEYRDIVDDSRFAYRNDLGELVSPTNREFFAVDQLASMIGLWGSRGGLDLRLGVNREDYGPSVYGGVREGRTVILWIHHDNNEERTRDLFFPMVDHFSGYKRVPADTVDEAQAKQEAADKQAQDLREAESKAKQDAEEQSRRDAEVKDKQDAEEQSKKDAEAKSAQSLQQAQDRKKNTLAAPLLFGRYTPSIDFGGGFKPPPSPAVVKKPTIDWGTFKLPQVNFNQPDESSNIKDSGKVTAEEADKKLAKEAAEKARQAAVSQTLENARRAENELRA